MSERELIDRLEEAAGAAPHWLAVGIGDDAAVLQPPRTAVVDTIAEFLAT